MHIPTEVKICPIVDAGLEIRFKTSIPSSAVFGILYNEIAPFFVKTDSLPITQIPEPIRETDPNFKFKPHYRLTNSNGYSLHIGPDVLLFGSIIPYQGWAKFSEFFYPVIVKIFRLNIIHGFIRLGQRVINLFEDVSHNDFKIKLEIINSPTPKNIITRTEHDIDGYLCVLQYSTDTSANVNGREIRGHLVDIDVSRDLQGLNFMDDFQNYIENTHKIEKKLFFDLLGDDLLKRLKPSYE